MTLLSRLCLGNWEPLLYAGTDYAETHLERFKARFSVFPFFVPGTGREREHLMIVGPDIIKASAAPDWLDKDSADSWLKFQEGVAAFHKFSNHMPFQYSYPQSLNERPLPAARGESQPPVLFHALFFNEFEEDALTDIYTGSYSLAMQWHIRQNGMLVHGSSIARNEQGFLFLGASEAGKTTVTQLSASVGYTPLGDDLNFIIRDTDGYRLGAAFTPKLSTVGYSDQQPLLKGIFKLVKSDTNQLIPLPPLQTTKVLMAGLSQVPFRPDLSKDLTVMLFQTCCDIARTIPGYELHFSKSPAFWDVIDAEFRR